VLNMSIILPKNKNSHSAAPKYIQIGIYVLICLPKSAIALGPIDMRVL
jgi:hypothetical protein